jgi:hypothetical protein
MSSTVPVEEEEEAADLSVLNDTIEGGRLWLSQGASLKPDESEGCSPFSGGRTIQLCSSWLSSDTVTISQSLAANIFIIGTTAVINNNSFTPQKPERPKSICRP